MVGQKNNLEFLQTCLDTNSFPRFIILTGPKGSGRKTLAKYIAKKCLRAYEIYPGMGVEAVRESIENSYRCAGATAYVFPDADKMSSQAKNALLKVTEEPPKQAYFIMTVESMNNTLATLKSRGTEIAMETYSNSELAEFRKPNNAMEELALDIATTPGQYLDLIEADAEKFYAFCEKVLDNISAVTGVNAFKIGNNFRFKEDGTGYDPILFFECVKNICVRRARRAETKEEIICLNETVKCTNSYMRELMMTGVKKDSTFDMWILAMRDIWKEVE